MTNLPAVSQQPATFANPFRVKPLPPRSAISRLLRREATDAARIAVENELASRFPNVLAIPELSAIEREYNIGPEQSRTIRIGVFSRAYRSVIADDAIGDAAKPAPRIGPIPY